MQNEEGEESPYQTSIHSVQLSNSSAQLNTTQYMSHGMSWAGSFAWRALYEAKMGKRNVAMELKRYS
jgi:hypothetical protein